MMAQGGGNAGGGGKGTITSITAGTGLTGGTITSSGTIGIDSSAVATKSYVQNNYERAMITVYDTGSGTTPTFTMTAFANNQLVSSSVAITAITIALPSSPTAGTYFTFVNETSTASINSISFTGGNVFVKGALGISNNFSVKLLFDPARNVWTFTN